MTDLKSIAPFAIDDHTFDPATIPLGNVEKLLRAAIGHKLRNEAASKVRGKLIAEAKERAGDAWVDGDERNIRYDAENEDHAALYRAAQAEMAELIRSGEIGAGRAGGPRLSESEKLAQTFARDQVLAIIQAPKFGFWTKDGKPIKNKFPTLEEVFTFKDGPRTFGSLIEGYAKANKEKIEKHVAKVLAERAKAAQAAINAAGEGDSLGF